MVEKSIRKRIHTPTHTHTHTHTHTRLGHFAVQQKLAQHCKSTILYILKNDPLIKVVRFKGMRNNRTSEEYSCEDLVSHQGNEGEVELNMQVYHLGYNLI